MWDIRSGLPEDHPDVARSSEFMGRIMMDLDQPAQAEPWFRRSAKIRRGLYQEDNPMRIDAERELGICLQELGRYEEAEDRLTIACGAFTTHFGAADERTVACEEPLRRLYEQWGRAPEGD